MANGRPSWNYQAPGFLIPSDWCSPPPYSARFLFPPDPSDPWAWPTTYCTTGTRPRLTGSTPTTLWCLHSPPRRLPDPRRLSIVIRWRPILIFDIFSFPQILLFAHFTLGSPALLEIYRLISLIFTFNFAVFNPNGSPFPLKMSDFDAIFKDQDALYKKRTQKHKSRIATQNRTCKCVMSIMWQTIKGQAPTSFLFIKLKRNCP